MLERLANEQEDPTGGFGYRLPLAGADMDEVEAMYYPGVDAVYLRSDELDVKRATCASPEYFDENDPVDHVQTESGELDILAFLNSILDRNVEVVYHEFTHGMLSGASAEHQPLVYDAHEANIRLSKLVAQDFGDEEGVESWETVQFHRIFAASEEIERFCYYTEPVQEALAAIGQAIMCDRPATERIAAQISDLDAFLEDVGYRHIHPGFVGGELDESRARQRQFNLSYQRAILAASHRIFTEVSEEDGIELFSTLAAAACAVSMALGDMDLSEKRSVPSSALIQTSPTAVFLSLIAAVLRKIDSIRALLNEELELQDIAYTIIEKQTVGVDQIMSVNQVMEERLTARFREEESDGPEAERLVSAYGERVFPTVMFIEEEASNQIRTIVNTSGVPTTFVIASLARCLFVSGVRHGYNPFEGTAFAAVLEELVDEFFSQMSGSEFLDELSALLEGRGTTIPPKAALNEYRNTETNGGVFNPKGVLYEDHWSLTEPTGIESLPSRLRPTFEALWSYDCDGSPSQLDGVFAGDEEPDTMEEFLAGTLTESLEAEELIARNQLASIDQTILEAISANGHDLIDYTRIYALAITETFGSEAGEITESEFELWVRHYISAFTEPIETQHDTVSVPSLTQLVFFSAAEAIITEYGAGESPEITPSQVQSAVRVLVEESERVAAEFDVRGVTEWGRVLLVELLEKDDADARTAAIALAVAGLVRAAGESERMAGRIVLVLAESVGRFAEHRPDGIVNIVARAVDSITAGYETVSVSGSGTRPERQSENTGELTVSPRSFFIDYALAELEDSDATYASTWRDAVVSELK